MADHHPEIDAATGRTTTGHEWDGIKELNSPCLLYTSRCV